MYLANIKPLLTGSQKTKVFCIMKQDKRFGVAVMCRSKYTKKCLHIVQVELFAMLWHRLWKTRYLRNCRN